MSPDNISAQQDLSIACGQVGSTLMAQGRHEAALEMYLKDIAINEDLTARDPQDATWQSDLAFGLYKAGECCDRLGRHADAALYWRRELQAREVLASLEEDPASSADQLASCHNQVGGALEAAGDQAGALAAFEAYLALSLGVLSADPEDATARRNVAVGQISVARGRMALGDLTAADSLLDAASATFRELLDTEDPGTLIDHAAAVALGAEIAERLGNAEALARRNAELLTIDLPPDGVVGRFRKRFAPLILARLERALADADAHVRAIAVLRALRLAAAALPSIELTPWKRHAREVADVLPAGHDLVERLRRLGN
jgi:tetratricopeptide (TPR) repeat protein